MSSFARRKLLHVEGEAESGGWGNNVLCVPLSTPRVNRKPLLFTPNNSLTAIELTLTGHKSRAWNLVALDESLQSGSLIIVSLFPVNNTKIYNIYCVLILFYF